MYQAGIVQQIRRNPETDWVEVQILNDFAKEVWYPVAVSPGFEYEPTLDDQVHILRNGQDQGVAFSLFHYKFLREEANYSAAYQSHTTNLDETEKDNIFAWKDLGGTVVGNWEKDGTLNMKEPRIYGPVPTIIRPIDGVDRTCYGLLVNGSRRYFPDML